MDGMGLTRYEAQGLHIHAAIALAQGRHHEAANLVYLASRRFAEPGRRHHLAESIDLAAELCVARRRYGNAAEAMAIAASLSTGRLLRSPAQGTGDRQNQRAVRNALGPDEFRERTAAGRGVAPETIISRAVGSPDTAGDPLITHPRHHHRRMSTHSQVSPVGSQRCSNCSWTAGRREKSPPALHQPAYHDHPHQQPLRQAGRHAPRAGSCVRPSRREGRPPPVIGGDLPVPCACVAGSRPTSPLGVQRRVAVAIGEAIAIGRGKVVGRFRQGFRRRPKIDREDEAADLDIDGDRRRTAVADIGKGAGGVAQSGTSSSSTSSARPSSSSTESTVSM